LLKSGVTIRFQIRTTRAYPASCALLVTPPWAWIPAADLLSAMARHATGPNSRRSALGSALAVGAVAVSATAVSAGDATGGPQAPFCLHYDRISVLWTGSHGVVLNNSTDSVFHDVYVLGVGGCGWWMSGPATPPSPAAERGKDDDGTGAESSQYGFRASPPHGRAAPAARGS